jgi:4-hydroxybenzoate polyprenyltransferase
LLFLFPLNLFLYGLNDITDVASDRRNPERGGARGAKLGRNEARELHAYIWWPPMVFLVVSALSGNLAHLGLAALWIGLSWAYSHPKVRCKEIPIVDTFVSAMIYLSPALIAYTLTRSLPSFPREYYALVFPVAGIHAITTLVDRPYDKGAKMTTTGVALGPIGTTLFAAVMFAIPLLTMENLVIRALSGSGIVCSILLACVSPKAKPHHALAATIAMFALASAGVIYFFLTL